MEFTLGNGEEMIVACLYSLGAGEGGGNLWSFAAITDEPPQEIAAARHDRCIIPIKAEHIDTWLNPEGNHRTA